MRLRRGSAERVVLPVPERPKKTVTLPSAPSLAEEWRQSCLRSGIWYIISVRMPFFISPAYCVPRMTISACEVALEVRCE